MCTMSTCGIAPLSAEILGSSSLGPSSPPSTYVHAEEAQVFSVIKILSHILNGSRRSA